MLPLLQVRQITALDLADCAFIDAQSTAPEAAWTPEDFGTFFAVSCRGGYVATWQGKAIAYLLYHADRDNCRLHLVRIGVAVGWRRRHVGSRLVQHIRQWLQPVPHVRVWVLVHERRLSLQCFLRANDFRVIRICTGRYDDGREDGYLFEMTVGRKHLQAPLPAGRGEKNEKP
jgi:ribosomal protein S18 acetylase RimI-like enzyme